jgi:hypothetical protein
MSRKSRMSVAAVEKLIEQRRLFQDWLGKLADNVEGMPPHVVERVRNDYRGRLDGVMAELAEHRDGLRESLEEAQQRHEGLEGQQQQRKDELAELRLRRHVGEVDDVRFKEQTTEMQGALDALRKELGAALRDIERYEEILDVIAEGDAHAVTPLPGEPEPEPAAAAEPAAVETAAEDEETAEPARGSEVTGDEPEAVAPPERERLEEKPSARPEAPAERRGVSRPGVDELAFLRSVTTTVGAVKLPPNPPAPPRKSPPAPSGPPAEEPVERVARVEHEEHVVGLDAAPGLLQLPPVEPHEPAQPSAGRASSTEGQLACKECGAVNRPTEWYCEKCGAELAAF